MKRFVQLDRFLLRNSEYSSRQLRRLILAGEVEVGGEVCRNIIEPVGAFTQVSMCGKTLQNRNALYIMLNKPKGVVSATKHPEHKTVIDCISDELSSDLHLAGRLDFNTTGLMLLTNDGHWSRKITQPEERKPKSYLVETEAPITEEYVEAFKRGIFLKFENITLMPASLNIISDKQARLSIFEGRYHQVKRMFGFFNNKVIALHREAMGKIQLDPGLKSGDYRVLSASEIASVGGC